MKKVGLAILFLTLSACAPEKKDQPLAAESELRISDIPKGCQFYYTDDLARGSHEFPQTLTGPRVILATGFDCGIRQGKRCFYYLAFDRELDGSIIDDVRCE